MNALNEGIGAAASVPDVIERIMALAQDLIERISRIEAYDREREAIRDFRCVDD